MRCYECGNRVTDGQEECPRCHAALWALGPTAAVNTAAAPLTIAAHSDSTVALTSRGRQDMALPPSRGEMVLQQTGAVVAGVASAAQSALALVIPPMRSVHGRVFIADSAFSEDPDLDVCKLITRILWIIILLPFLIVAAAVCLMFRRSSPINLFAMLGVFRFLNPVARNNAQVPVRYFRIREDDTGSEVMVRMKGQLTHGNIGQEDLVTLSGRSRGGTLYAQDGYNHRTASTIRLARSYSWIGLILTILFALAAGVAVHAPTARVARTVNSIGGAR
jgi:hypothetical protein